MGERERERAAYDRGVRDSITWLHMHASQMNDPHAKAVLNTAAFGLGVEKQALAAALSDQPADRTRT